MKNDSDKAISKLPSLSPRVLEGIFNMAACLPEENQEHLALYFQTVVKEQKVLEELQAFTEADPAFLEEFKALVSYMEQSPSCPAGSGRLVPDLEAIQRKILSRKEGDRLRQQEELFLALEVFSEWEWFRRDQQTANDPFRAEAFRQMVRETIEAFQAEQAEKENIAGHPDIVPGASSVIAAMDDRKLESFLRGVEEIPLGFVATEFLRPLVRSVADPGSVDPGMLEDLAISTKNYFSSLSLIPGGNNDYHVAP